MDGNINNNQTISELTGKIEAVPRVDKTLSKEGCAADAKEVGERLRNIDPHFADNVQYDNTDSNLLAVNVQEAIDALKGITDATKETLLRDYFGVHNKPIKTYKGNGSATIRQIQIGGAGEWLALRTDSSIIGLVTFNGAVAFSLASNNMGCLSASEINFRDGVLTLKTDNSLVNYSDVTYTCKVL